MFEGLVIALLAQMLPMWVANSSHWYTVAIEPIVSDYTDSCSSAIPLIGAVRVDLPRLLIDQ